MRRSLSKTLPARPAARGDSGARIFAYRRA
jgi:hypothetical protein